MIAGENRKPPIDSIPRGPNVPVPAVTGGLRSVYLVDGAS